MKNVQRKLLQENSGFSLVELLVAVMIVSIVGASLVAFVQQSSNTYNHSSAETDVQEAAQFTANAITDRVIDCETQLKFYDGSIDVTTGLPVSFNVSYYPTYSSDPADLIVLNNAKILQLINNSSQTKSIIFFDQARNVIYFNETTWDSASDDWNGFDPEDAEMLADNVQDFTVNTDKLTSDKILEFDLTYALRNRDYTGNYQVHMRNKDVEEGSDATPERPAADSIVSLKNDPATIRMEVKANQPLDIKWTDPDSNPYIYAKVVSTGSADTAVDWSLSSDPDATGVDIVPDPADPNRISLRQHTITPIPDPTVKSFRVISTSREDPTKIGYTTIKVVKALGVWVNPYTPLRNNDMGQPVSTKNATITFNANVDGWNLEGNEQVTWKIYKDIKDGSGNFAGNWQEANSITEAAMNGNTVLLRNNINSAYRFKVEATSVFDNTVKGEYVFYIADSILTSDIQFLRGVNMDLKSYYMVNPTEIAGDVTSVISIDKIEVTNVPDYTGNFSDFVYFDNNYVLYVDYDAYHDGDFTRKARFYQGLQIGLKVDFTTPTGTDSRTTTITLPAVQVLKVGPTDNVLVIRKGTTSDITLSTLGFNITKSSQMSMFMDGTQVGGSSSGANKYLSCRMVTTENGKSLLGTRDKGVTEAKFRLTAASNTREYPEAPITLTLALDDYYVISNKAADSYVQYTVYVANVEGVTAYIPEQGRDGLGKKYQTRTVSTPTGNLNIKLRVRNGNLEMEYNGLGYVYDSTYHYWRRNNR
ncbi:MAG: type II secretion system GspH family protein [Roseburia sp.]|nr:type II secretion system GspH family protein [Roseburia sp.]MCM1278057.1 type II secretion system GspH family protein [Robinsoniella sp.]